MAEQRPQLLQHSRSLSGQNFTVSSGIERELLVSCLFSFRMRDHCSRDTSSSLSRQQHLENSSTNMVERDLLKKSSLLTMALGL